MTMIIHHVYHWAPSERREEILRDGLKVYSQPVTHTSDHRFPYLCFGFTPSGAWGYSGAIEWANEIEEWDLWQVSLTKDDEIHIRSEFGNELIELRVKNSIHAERIWFVGQRSDMLDAKENNADKGKKKAPARNARKRGSSKAGRKTANAKGKRKNSKKKEVKK